jgi:hypothetical protein
MGIFATLFGGKALKKGIKKGTREIQAAQTESLGFIEPFAKTGINALGYFGDAAGIGDSDAAIARFQDSPEYRLLYDTAIEEGRRGVENLGQGAGTYNSGRTLKALQDRGVATTNKFFGDYTNRLGGLTDLGFNAAGQKANIRTQGANALAGQYKALGEAKAAQYAGFDDLIGGGLKFLGGAF